MLIQPRLSEIEKAPMIENPLFPNELKGLRGWLVLPGWGVVLTTITLVATTALVFNRIFLITVGSEVYDPLFASFFIWEIIYNSAMIIASLYLISFFFSKHYFFPKFYIAFVAVYLFLIPLDIWLITLVLPDDYLGVGRAIAVAPNFILLPIWIPYLLLSKRVKATFVERMPNKSN